MINYVFNRIITGFSHSLCLKKPNVIFVFIKLLEDGMKIFHKCISNPRSCLNILINVYYYIYTTYKHNHILKDLVGSPLTKKNKEKEKYEILR